MGQNKVALTSQMIILDETKIWQGINVNDYFMHLSTNSIKLFALSWQQDINSSSYNQEET